MGKKSFIIYQNWARLIENLEDLNAGILIKAICAHVNGKTVKIDDVSINAIFQMIAEKISEDSEKYEEVSQTRREAANKRWNAKECKSMHKHINAMQKHYDTDTDTDTDTDKNIKRVRAVFRPPTVEEVKAYCQERNNKVNAESFIDFYESKGWMVGKNKMKDWKACVRTWEQRDNQKTAISPKIHNFDERNDYDFDALEKRLARN